MIGKCLYNMIRLVYAILWMLGNLRWSKIDVIVFIVLFAILAIIWVISAGNTLSIKKNPNVWMNTLRNISYSGSFTRTNQNYAEISWKIIGHSFVISGGLL